VEFSGDFFVVNDVDIHKLNFKPLKSLKLLVENPIKKRVFLSFLIIKTK
jgi:hypothetical protein